jgi:signal peptidase I
MTAEAYSDADSRPRFVRKGVLYLALAICVINYGIKEWIIWPVKVCGESMLPNYTDGQSTYINKLAYVTEPPQRGDVVGVRLNNGEVYIKRIVGLPGELVQFDRGTVIVNRRPLDEPYPVRSLLWQIPPFKLGPDEYFVMGDNRRVSTLGPINRKHIIGRAIF